ncbi:hypothetical protein TNIN_422051 [Trichonephila inaurata madagascariensis]|uniref:Uncharacterized protein n=1 Tax=Trichonephila inaurata madagascariensis TaxID=2747483 RepID=A0A8X6YXJ9_9ARAC|nr:hypothetical protein TNIN_422051 [Trichonephila inaurata madagascariensis]
MSGEISIPPQLLDFYFTLLSGWNKKRKKSMKCASQVRSYSQDVIFAVHNGHVKTPKHIMLDINRFEKAIKKISIDNFSKDYEKKRKVKVGGTIQEIKIQRDLFGRMLGISMDYNSSSDEDENIDDNDV